MQDTRSSASPAPTCLQRAAAEADAVIHLAFTHDLAFTGDFAGAAQSDRRAIEAFADALAGSNRPFLIASGTLGVAPGRVATEHVGHEPVLEHLSGGPEIRHASHARARGRSVRSCVVRLPPKVHGAGDHGFLATLVEIARATGTSAYIGDGTNRWPAVHRADAARLFRLALDARRPGRHCMPRPTRTSRSATSPR
jgi:nucleoside-diphosphate-sugar epimerase